MKNINNFFSTLRYNAGAIWVEGEMLKLSTPKEFQNQNTKDFILQNKNKIISILKENGISTKEIFHKKTILVDTITTEFPLSPAQEGLWFMEQFEGGTNAFHIPTVYEVTTDTDIEGIKCALQQIVSRHEVLRSTIEQGSNLGHSIQKVQNGPLLIEEKMLSDVNIFKPLLNEDINRPFDLSKEYPMRVILYIIKSMDNNSGNKTFLLINKHHIASDAWSEEIFQKELISYYEAYTKKDKAFKLPDLEIQYKDYAVWQKAYLTGDLLEKQLDYWKSKLSGYQTLAFPTDYSRQSKIDYKGGREEFIISKELSTKLRALTKKYGLTLQSVMLSGLNILLNKYTGQDDIVVGSPIAARQHRQTEELIGFFINNQVNRTLLNKSQNFSELIQQVHQDQIAAQLNQDLPFEKLVSELRVDEETFSHPIFQVLFSVTNFTQQNKAEDQQNKYLIPFKVDEFYEIEKLDFSIYVVDNGQEELWGLISYAKSLFKKDTMVRLINHYINLLDKLTKYPDKRYSEINLLSSEEYDQIIYKWNAEEKSYSLNKTLINLFEEQVTKTPDNIAVIFDGKALTYQQLDDEADKLANYFRANYNIQTNDLIGIMLDRSEKVIIAMMGILKAGAAYVFIDPEYPVTRKKYIIEDTAPKVLITQADYIFDLEFYKGNLFAIDLQLDSIETSMQLSKAVVTPNDLAYVNYTSGTTGNPKGVMIEHKSVINLIHNQVDCFGIKSEDKVLQFASYVFDASVSEIFTAITTGAQLLIIPNELKKDANLLSDYIEKHNVSIATVPPVLLGLMPYRKFISLKTLVVAGETCSVEQMIKWRAERKLINAYGPTENTVCATMHKYETGDLNTNIGKPIANTSAYILDSNNNPVPVGVIGELYVGGASLARGYLNNSELTKGRFVLNPFATEADKSKDYNRLYKTGDLARWLPDGNIEYIGRNDDQVKIRGYRIELGEIENALMLIEGITQVCVLVKERKTETSTTKYLVAYYVIDNSVNKLTQADIQGKLSLSLPNYMIPDNFILMESFPLTINGKLNKHALPNSDFKPSGEKYIAPTTEAGILACKIWQEVLGLEQIGMTDNFFRIGGNSILAIQISHLMSTSLRYDVKVADIFKWKTIDGLFENIKPKDITFENVEKEF